MKKIILSALLITVFASCKKLNDVLPASDISNPQTGAVIPTAEEGKLLASLKVTPVVENAQQQIVKASVSGTTLNLAYAEKVHLIIDKDRYTKSWYIVFDEDFKNTQLNGLDYKMKMQWGDTVLNWKPYNLHQIDKTVTDTTIGGVKVVNVKFERTFNFFKQYATAQEANNKLEEIAGKKEQVKFLTRYQPDTDTTRFYVNTANLVYTK
ncbi:hypothetical protein EOD41_13415 [Mucilaginibacter limnophilus]|uniref:Uncharacterized protein n=1 Tax=Mucilaginibacter limnophilus TaxID=1932778 RepID=A0A3S2VM19_9SPHI|nr:hypothetical protein [Mucilaginibacter limnophilus]RVU00470.1 hypothetical protein EOD41_13415 [Mucilaginibacter limnophilus]